MEEPVKSTVYERTIKGEGSEPDRVEKMTMINIPDNPLPAKVVTSEPVHPALKNPLYLSYYVRPGTDLHKELIKAEKVYELGL